MAKFAFDDQSARRIARTVRREEARYGNAGIGRADFKSVDNRPVLEGQLTTALSPLGTATLDVYRGNTSPASTGETYTVTDRVGFSGASGDWVIAMWINGEWRVISLDPATQASDNCFPVVSDVFCSGGSLVVCTRTICLPDEDVGVEGCGGGDPGTGTGSGTAPAPAGGIVTSCCANALNTTLYATMTSSTCAAFSSQAITWSSANQAWQGTFALGTCGRNITLSFSCTSVVFSGFRCDISFSDTCMAPQTLAPTTGQCDPLSASFPFTFVDACHDGSGNPTHTITITE